MRSTVRIFVVLAAIATGVLLAPRGAFAQYYGPAYGPPAYGPPPGYRPAPRYAAPYYYGGHEHDGFFLRANVGFGYMTASESYGGFTDTYSGGGLSYGLALGGIIAPNLVLYGEVMGTTVWDPNYSVSDGRPSQTLQGVDMTMFGIGPGVAYYFMPVNAFVSGTVLLTKVTFSDSFSGLASDSDFGVGLSLMGGKEWWVAHNLGVGLAAQLYLGTMGDHPYDSSIGQTFDTHLSTLAFSLLFQATFN